jgi:hypothetical protein
MLDAPAGIDGPSMDIDNACPWLLDDDDELMDGPSIDIDNACPWLLDNDDDGDDDDDDDELPLGGDGVPPAKRVLNCPPLLL